MIPRVFGAACLSLVLMLASCGDDDPSDTASVDDQVDETTAGATDGDGADISPEDSTATGPVVTDAWSRQPAEGQSVAAVYGIVSNPTDGAITLVGVSTPVTDQAELHETTSSDDGMMTMAERDGGFVIEAGGELLLEPGGAHVMLLGIDAATYPNAVEMTFEFADADPVTVTARVETIDGADGDMDHGDAGETDDEEAGAGGSGRGGAQADDSSDMAAPVIDVGPLHGLDDELAAGTLAANRQRAVVADYLAIFEDAALSDGAAELDLLALLNDLDAALAAEDLPTAAALATQAHDLAHAIEDGTAG